MLNISENSVSHYLPEPYRHNIDRQRLPASHRLLRIWLVSLSVIGFILLFLPWTQNIQAKGKVTTLSPDQRPQTVNATIAGRIERWYVREGQLVKKGDTLVHLSEVRTEYFDPNLVGRTANQVRAKQGSIEAYAGKADALAEQIAAMRQELSLKQPQLAAKVDQVTLKLESQRADLEQALVALEIAGMQLARTDTLFQRGIKSRTELEDKRQKLQEVQARAVAAENKVGEVENELEVARLELRNVVNEYNNKIAKAESDRFATLSERYTAEGELNKTQVEYENYAQRQGFYYILAPQDAYITQVSVPGVGEIIREGEALVSIMPADYELAVEMYVRPMDLPLVQPGQEVRFLFDGWPAIVFSGWPELTFGVYTGRVAAIDNTPGADGNYRILVGPDPNDRPWPEALRPGSGAQGLALLERVPVWYELWRRLNGFPPDYYIPTEAEKGEDPKFKAPLKNVK